MRVPEDAADGKVTVKVSFPAFTAFPIAATTGEITIRKAPAPEAPPK